LLLEIPEFPYEMIPVVWDRSKEAPMPKISSTRIAVVTDKDRQTQRHRYIVYTALVASIESRE